VVSNELLSSLSSYSYQYHIVELGVSLITPYIYNNGHFLLFAMLTEVLFQSDDLLDRLNTLNIEISIEERNTISKNFPGTNDPTFTNYIDSFDTTNDSFTDLITKIQDFLDDLLFKSLQVYHNQLIVIQKENHRREFITRQ
jgi:hypothetical protein